MNRDSIVLCYAGQTLPEQKGCLHSSSFDLLLAAAVKSASKCAIKSQHFPPIFEGGWSVGGPPRMEKREAWLTADQKG